MKAKLLILLLVSHVMVGFLGFAVGIYTLPILSAPEAPSEAEIKTVSAKALYQTEFIRELKDSDSLHWGEGKVSISNTHVSLLGELAPGPKYKLYFSPTFVETEAEFKQLKHTMIAAANIDTFDNFMVEISAEVAVEDYNSVIVWCESFEQFITAAKYK